MTARPTLVPLRALVHGIEAGKSFGGSAPPAGEDEWGLIRVSAMTSGVFRPTENKAIPVSAVDRRYEIRTGDLLVSRANTTDYVGASVLVGAVRPRLLLSDKSLRLRLRDDVEPRWLHLMLSSPPVRSQISAMATGTSDSMRNISQANLLSVEVPLISIDTQRETVDVLEEHLSRLDAARDYLAASKRRLVVAHRAILSEVIPDVAAYPPHWEVSTVGDAGLVELGRQRHPEWHTGSNVRPYLRVANVFEDDIRTDDLKEMHWPGETFDRFKVHPGDILLNEGQTPDLLGRPALYRGDPPDVAFTNSLIRFRAREGVLPEFALLVFRRHMHAKRFKRESRITTNIAHLSAARLKPIEFPIPPIEEQRALVEHAGELLEANHRVRDGIMHAEARSEALRRGVLSAAFSGRLTGRASDMDRVEELAAAGAPA